jgi:hypothetical protein
VRDLRSVHAQFLAGTLLKASANPADAGFVQSTRAFVGSLGAGLSVAVAASAMLLVVSTVVAFRGWPDDLGSSSDPVSRLVSGAASGPRSATGASERGASPLVLPATSSPAAAPTHRSRRPRNDARGGTTPVTATTGPTANGPAPSATTSPGSAGSTVSPQGESRLGGTIRKVTTNTGGAVTDTTKKAADVVRPVAPTVSDTVDRTGSAVGDTVAKTGDAVAQALSKLGE